ncbi:MAG TPA: hypothetical protein VN372_07975 [Methanospirillum sp.]|nr:hypothetical protein [Methanospirillum sp.]
MATDMLKPRCISGCGDFTIFHHYRIQPNSETVARNLCAQKFVESHHFSEGIATYKAKAYPEAVLLFLDEGQKESENHKA